MATMLGSLLVSLGLDSGEFKSGLDAAEKEMRKAERNIKGVGRNMQKLGQTLSVGLTAPITAVSIAFGRAAGNMARESKSMANSARLAGVGFEDFQRMAYASSVKVGIDFEKLGDIFKDTQDKMGDFASTGGGEMADFFENIAPKVGLTVDAFRNLSGREGLQLYYNALEQAGVSQDQMVFYLESIADEASGLIPLLRDNGRAFEELGKKATIVTESDAASLQEYTEAQLRLEGATRKLTIAFVNSGLLDTLVSIARSVAEVAEKMAKASPEAFRLAAGTAAVLAAIGPLAIGIGAVTKVLAPAIAGIKTFGSMVVAMGVASGSALPILAGLRAAIISLTASIAPWAAAIVIVGSALYILTNRSAAQTAETERLANQQRIAKDAADKLEQATGDLATAHGEARKGALEAAKAEYENTKQKRDAAWWTLQMAKAELRLAQVRTRTQRNSTTGGVAGTAGFIQGQGDTQVAAKRDEVQIAERTLKILEDSLTEAFKSINAPPPPNGGYVPPADTGSSRSNKRSGPTVAEIEQRYHDELAGYYQQTWSAMSAVATSAEERAELELRGVELARLRTLKQIETDADYNEAQKKALSESVEFLADRERAAIEFQKTAELEREAAEMARTKVDIERDRLDLDYEMADTQVARKQIASDILALEQAYRRNQLEMVIASTTAADAEKKRAQAILDSLDAIEAGERSANARRNETDSERWWRGIDKSGEQIGEELDQIKINGLENLNDQLTDAIVNFKSLKDVVHNVVKSILADLVRLAIQQAIIKPLAQGLGLGVPGFATGTSFAPGGLALVGERGPELVNLPRGSKVYTNGVSKAMLGGAGGAPQNFTFNFPGITNEREAREAGSQAALRFRRTLNGPLNQ